MPVDSLNVYDTLRVEKASSAPPTNSSALVATQTSYRDATGT